ncbi:response regulator [Paenibacillus tuaregi]|uniref:response regulator n=1 Tax=Paenibacillus tuaregi TaxID=1816681 RepID=UPI000B1907D8|nr:response regulator [Paenibacillus tuaregi]
MLTSTKLLPKRKLILLTAVFLLILTGIRLLWNYELRVPDHPEPLSGVVDLRGWQFDDSNTITLNGEWEFYPNTFLAPGTYQHKPKPVTAVVPGIWDHVTGTGSSIGFGTYRLTVLLDPSEQMYGIRVPNIQTASRLYVNGQELGVMGRPSVTKEESKARNVPYSVFFRSDKPEVEILIHVSNFDLPTSGGIIQSLRFGTDTAVTREAFFSENLQFIVCIVIALHGIYAAILYYLGVRGKELFYFVGIVVTVLLAVLMDDDKLLLQWVPIGLEWSTRLRVLAYMACGVSLFFWVKTFTGTRTSWFTRGYAWVNVLFTIVIVLVPMEWIKQAASFILRSVMIVTVITEIRLMVTAIYRREITAVFLLLSVAAVSANRVWGTLKGIFWPDQLFYPFDLIIAFLGLASFWFVRFAQMNKQAEQLAEQLQKADKIKDDFLANTSHELRNPLHGMLNMAQAVRSEAHSELGPEHKNRMDLLIQVGQRMSLQLDDLLDAARLKEQELHLVKKSISFSAAASGVIDMLRVASNSSPVDVQLRIPDQFPYVIADENRLVQIIFNLLQEALRVTQQGAIVLEGSVREGMAAFRIYSPAADWEEIKCSAGAELNNDQQLRMNICRQLIELHGGTFKVITGEADACEIAFSLRADFSRSENRLGSDVSMDSEFEPWDSDEGAIGSVLAEQEAAVTAETRARHRILAVDDDPINLKVLGSILGGEDYQLVTATSGKEALDHLEQGEWDLVISDVMMPQMSGYELTRTIRRQFSLSELPVLLLTARSQQEDIQAGFLSGANDYLTKPVGGIELKSRVKALIDLKESISERLRMEAAWLQAQIQPHFLFNTLNSIASLSETDTSRMVILLEEFGNYLRTSFDARNLQRLVPISHELQLLRSYLYIEQERFGSRLKVVWEVPEPLSVEIPPLSIQPLAENAVRHGILQRARGGTLTIRITEHPQEVAIVIKDDGVGMDQATLLSVRGDGSTSRRRGVGVQNTDRRLKRLYGRGLEISSIPDQGTTVAFSVPK